MRRRPELWVGPECTVNRVGDTVHDQLRLTGVHSRLDDLDRMAGLGATRMRFPLLWERSATATPAVLDWRWADLRLERLRALGVAPIAGLLHHGSGPRWTNLLDPGFPAGLAAYAAAAARRYPHIDAWTPVNEPNTTARFAALYGHWHPHRRDEASYLRALMQQVSGTVLAMRAIREVIPRAQLVQTDDLGCTRSTPLLADQAEYENHRRWLGWDLLAGRVDRHHPLWARLLAHGIREAELLALVDAPCPPDIIGINRYVTSERFLDERVARWPGVAVGGNGRHTYVDVETVRVPGERSGGFLERLRETWARYGLPVALTEVHLGCTREEQLRWLDEAWRDAEQALAEGIEVPAVTAWAAFGSVDWDSLVTRRTGRYESGLWDVRADPPRATALAGLARQLARGQRPDHPVLQTPGWWRRDLRHGVPPAAGAAADPPHTGTAPLLVAGADGTLGRAFVRVCGLRGLSCRVLRRAELDIADPASVEAALALHRPWALVNAAGFVRVDDAEGDARQWRENAVGPGVLARACARHGVALLGFSSDLVFGGDKRSPYLERDPPGPLSAYGRAKLEAERLMQAHAPRALIVRSAAFFGPWDRHNFVTLALQALARGERFAAASDQVVSPTYVPHLVHAALDLLIDGASGVWHLANDGAVTWAELARMAAEGAGLEPGRVDALPGVALGWRAPRPAYSALTGGRGSLLPSLRDGLAAFLAERAATPPRADAATA